MSPTTRTPRRTAGALLLAAALAVTSACAAAASGEQSAPKAKQATYDATLAEKLPQAVRDRGVLRVGTDASYAPMSSFGPDGRTIVGVEPDLGRQIGKVLGVRVEFVQQGFTDLLPRIRSGELDLAMSAITDTQDREREVDFVNYFSAGTAILVRRGNPEGITEIKDLCGEAVAVEKGTVQVDLLQRTQVNCVLPIDINTFATNSDALVQLRTGRAVAVLNDLPPAAFLVTDRRTSAQYQLASTTQYEPGLYGVAVAKNQLELRDAVQGAFEDLVSSGVYADVLDRWGVANGAIETITVNSGI